MAQGSFAVLPPLLPPRTFVAGAAQLSPGSPRHPGRTLVAPCSSGTRWNVCCGAHYRCRRLPYVRRRSSPSRRRSGPPPAVRVVPSGSRCYCAPVGALGSRRRALCRRRLAGDRVGSACRTVTVPCRTVKRTVMTLVSFLSLLSILTGLKSPLSSHCRVGPRLK